MKKLIIIFSLVLISSGFSNEILIREQEKILKHFDQLTADIGSYEKLIDKECSDYPEGDLFPYTFPAIAYTLLEKEHSEKRALALLKLAQKYTERVVNSPILNLSDYRDMGTFLGQYNLALSVYLTRYKNVDLQKQNDHLSKLLLKAFHDNNYAQIKSYPNLTWSFDSIPALLSIKLNKSIPEKVKKDFIQRHLKWSREKNLEPKTQLPYSVFSKTNPDPPRGCDLSFRLPLLFHLDKGYARQLYKSYCQHFWKVAVFSGFREYQDETKSEDVDSGPIIFGLGATATAFSYPCFEVFEDTKKKNIYMAYLSTIPVMKSLVKETGSSYSAELNDKSYTGLYFGDCALFYNLTWHLLDKK